MLKNEHYCIGIRAHPTLKGGKVLSMDMELMEQEGFAVEAFYNIGLGESRLVYFYISD